MLAVVVAVGEGSSIAAVAVAATKAARPVAHRDAHKGVPRARRVAPVVVARKAAAPRAVAQAAINLTAVAAAARSVPTHVVALAAVQAVAVIVK